MLYIRDTQIWPSRPVVLLVYILPLQAGLFKTSGKSMALINELKISFEYNPYISMSRSNQ